MKQEISNRQLFEKWITAFLITSYPPIEANIERFPLDIDADWAGQYKAPPTELAWKAWEEACNATRKDK